MLNVNHFIKSISAHRNIAFLIIKGDAYYEKSYNLNYSLDKKNKTLTFSTDNNMNKGIVIDDIVSFGEEYIKNTPIAIPLNPLRNISFNNSSFNTLFSSAKLMYLKYEMSEVRIGEAKVLIDENHRILSVEPINETFGTRLDESNSYTLEQLANSREFPFLNKLARRALEKLKEDEESK